MHHPLFHLLAPKASSPPQPSGESLPVRDSDNSILTQYPKRPVGVDLVERIWTKGKC